MNSQDSLDRLRTLVLLCQQLSFEESEALMRESMDDPQQYAGDVAGLCSDGRVQLPEDLVSQLHRDRAGLALAV